MATLIPSCILIVKRSISSLHYSSKLFSWKSSHLPTLSTLDWTFGVRMSSTVPVNATEVNEDEGVETRNKNDTQLSSISRPSIIKTVPAATLPSDGVIQPVQRPSVICAVKNSVLIENLSPPKAKEPEPDPADKAEPDVVDLSVEKPNNNVKPETADKVAEKSSTTDEKSQKKRTRKFVLMLSYSGTGYLGMQRNPGTKTIEDDLFQSLLKSKYIDEESYNRPQLLNFQRAARTDKGVSAARQIVSIKLPENVTAENINQYLPQQIRVMGLKRVTKGFDSKNSCDARTYSYMMPTFAFVPMEEQVTEAYRITPEVLETVRQKLAMYVGLKNYHNFTSRKKPGDPSAQRIIMSFTCSDPFIQDGLEFVVLRVKGQSFMMHQIRKMIGLVTAVVRGFASDDVFEKAFTLKRIDIPRAPGLGLMLDQVHYERYDKKFGKDGHHESLTWDDVQTKVKEFCQEYIYSNVTKLEKEEKSMFEWLQTLAYHTYDEREHEPLIIDGKLINPSESGIGKAWRKTRKEQGENEDDSDDVDDDEDDEIPRAKKAKVAS